MKYKWTKELCAEEALKYNSRSEFERNCGSAVNSARTNGWMDEICSHMTRLHKPNNYWTKEKCAEEALKYKTRGEFCKNSSAYEVSRDNTWLDEICSHMILNRNIPNYWTKEKCLKESLKYNTRTEFAKGCHKAYTKSVKKKWLDEICSHMKKVGNLYKRCIYSYEFSDNHVYIGLTYNLEKRNRRHTNDKDSQVHIHIEQTGIEPILNQLTDYIDINEASNKEKEFVEKYRNNNWTILNIAKAGGIGSNIVKWTKEKCIEESLKYVSRTDFIHNNGSAYQSVCKNNWWNDIPHIKSTRKGIKSE